MKAVSSVLPRISVVIPAYNEERYIEQCLNSVLSQDYPLELMQVIVIDGDSTDRTAEIVRYHFPQVALLENPRRIVPLAMNLGIKAADGEYIVRIDVHAIYPSNYISTLIVQARELNADNVGVCCETLPSDNSCKARAIAIATSTKFGMGNSQFRLGTDRVRRVDTVPFGCYHRSVFDKIGFYDEELVRNQDDEFNARLIKHGGTIYLLPDVTVKYFARGTVKKVARMFYQYGLFKPLCNKKLKKIYTVRQLVPFAFVAYLVLALVLALILPKLTGVILIPLFIYILIDLVYSAFVAKSFGVYLWLVVVYPVVHVSYGIGYWSGIVKILLRLPFRVTSSR